MQYKTSNPVFHHYFWNNSTGSSHKMSLNGILLKTFIALILISSSIWYMIDLAKQGKSITWYFYGGLLTAIVLSVLTSYKKKWSPITVPLYGIAKGLFLGGIIVYTEAKFKGLSLQALSITICTLFVMLILYKLRIVKVTKRFRSILYTAIMTIMVIYIIGFILRFFDITLNIIYGSSWYAIGFTIIAACVAAFSLLLDFDFMDRKINKAPKYMEWVATWGLLVSLIWLYVEVIRLLKKLAIRF
jgi:uncharacterized YccA/Bax inhibitor family protein